MKLRIELREKSYDIHIEKGILHKIKEYINLDRKVMIVTDKGVPEKYMNIVKAQCPNGYSIAVEQGEQRALKYLKKYAESFLIWDFIEMI